LMLTGRHRSPARGLLIWPVVYHCSHSGNQCRHMAERGGGSRTSGHPSCARPIGCAARMRGCKLEPYSENPVDPGVNFSCFVLSRTTPTSFLSLGRVLRPRMSETVTP
jgi:hypothetical protein